MGFDNDLYLKLQSEKIKERIKMFDNKLYMEFGGKIFDDLHASRVFPGFLPDSKIRMLQKLKDKLEIILCINSSDIEKKKIRADYGITYDSELLRLIDRLRELDLYVSSVVITQFQNQISVLKFRDLVESKGVKTYIHTFTKGYPTDVDTIVSEEGYGANSFIETTKPLVVVSAPGASSGKLATCLSQLYHEHKRGVKAGYAKFETFPVWDLPLKHPINMAYEAATANIGDVNMIDNFHLEKYGIMATNYNRDIAIFPVLKNILFKITGKDIYYSPTDMGLNTVGKCIKNEKIIVEASKSEIIRRYLNSLCDYKNGHANIEEQHRIKMLMDELKIFVNDRKVLVENLKKEKEKGTTVVTIQIGKKFITGKDNDIMTASASAVINTLKELSSLDDSLKLISPIKFKPMLKYKRQIYKDTRLNINDILTALAISEATNPTNELVLSKLPLLFGLDAHASSMIPKVEIDTLKKLGLNITCTDKYYN